MHYLRNVRGKISKHKPSDWVRQTVRLYPFIRYRQLNGTVEEKRQATRTLNRFLRDAPKKLSQYVVKMYSHKKYYTMKFSKEYQFIATTNNPAEQMFA